MTHEAQEPTDELSQEHLDSEGAPRNLSGDHKASASVAWNWLNSRAKNLRPVVAIIQLESGSNIDQTDRYSRCVQ